MKKIILSIVLIAVLGGVVLWSGVIWLLGSGAEAALKNPGIDSGKPDGQEWLSVVGGDFERGFLSSQGETLVGLRADDADGDGKPDNGVKLSHQIYHGPLAITPDGIIPCTNYIVTTLAEDSLPEEVREALKMAFGDKVPLTIRTTAGVGRSVTSQLTVSPFAIDLEGDGWTTRFDGLNATVTASGDEESVTSLAGQAAMAGWGIEGPGAKILGEPGSAVIDFQDGKSLKIQLDLGSISGTGEQFSGRIGGLKVNVDQARGSDRVPLYLGETRFDLPEMNLTIAGEKIGMKDGLIIANTGNEGGKLHGLVRYGIGAVTIPDELAGPMVGFLPALEGGLQVEVGGRGIELAAAEMVMEKAQDLQKWQTNLLASGTTNAAEVESPEYRKALADYLREVVNAIGPGTELSQKLQISGRTGKSGLGVTLTLTGDRPLTKLTTFRQLVNAVSADASVQISKADLTPDSLAMLAMGLGGSGFIIDEPTQLSGKARLQGGVLSVNGQPAPFLEMLGPQLDEEIPWELIFSSMETP
jgi:hypothetical protein